MNEKKNTERFHIQKKVFSTLEQRNEDEILITGNYFLYRVEMWHCSLDNNIVG